MSRKTILAIIGGLGVVGGFVSQEFGLTVQLGSLFVGIGAALVYVFGEMKLDLARFRGQTAKFKDPKFWAALVAVVVAYVGSLVDLPIPGDTIVLIVTIILGLVFGQQTLAARGK